MAQIPPALIGTAGPILDAHYTHAELNALFMQAGFPGDPPEGNKTHKCLSWMRRANAECSNPLKLFGALIAELMDGEPTAWRLDVRFGYLRLAGPSSNFLIMDWTSSRLLLLAVIGRRRVAPSIGSVLPRISRTGARLWAVKFPS